MLSFLNCLSGCATQKNRTDHISQTSQSGKDKHPAGKKKKCDSELCNLGFIHRAKGYGQRSGSAKGVNNKGGGLEELGSSLNNPNKKISLN